MDPRRPARSQAGDERADRGRGVERAERRGPPSRPAASAGNSASGMPKTIATKSTT